MRNDKLRKNSCHKWQRPLFYTCDNYFSSVYHFSFYYIFSWEKTPIKDPNKIFSLGKKKDNLQKRKMFSLV